MEITQAFRRQALRAAVKIHERLTEPARPVPNCNLPHAAWENLRHTFHQWNYAEQRAWRTAGQSLVPEIDYAVRRCQRELDALRQSVTIQHPPEPVASARDILCELVALAGDFETVAIDLREHTISVVTDAITLEACELGPFRVVLDWERLGASPAYHCEALEPCCPSDRDDVTHPHVLDQQLCEGAGTAAIERAVKTGRLYDFFLLVRQILATYNPQSAHVTLDNWRGGCSCSGCGISTRSEECASCERCGELSCNDCAGSCQGCSRSICSGCANFCGRCDDRFCQQCLTTPAGATQRLCANCQPASPPEPLEEALHAAPENTFELDAEGRPALAPAAPSALAATAPTTDGVCLGQTTLSPGPRADRSRRVRRQPSRRPAAGHRRGAPASNLHTGHCEV